MGIGGVGGDESGLSSQLGFVGRFLWLFLVDDPPGGFILHRRGYVTSKTRGWRGMMASGAFLSTNLLGTASPPEGGATASIQRVIFRSILMQLYSYT